MVPVRLEQNARMVTLARAQLVVEVGLSPLTIRLARRGGWLIQELTLFAQEWSGGDRLIHLTEGVMVEEERGEPAQLAEAELRGGDGASVELGSELADGQPLEVRVSIADDERVTIELEPGDGPSVASVRLGASWAGRYGERLTGLGARHSEGFDQRGRRVRLGADRRYTGPDCPPDMLETGGIPQGDCAPAPWLLSSAVSYTHLTLPTICSV